MRDPEELDVDEVEEERQDTPARQEIAIAMIHEVEIKGHTVKSLADSLGIPADRLYQMRKRAWYQLLMEEEKKQVAKDQFSTMKGWIIKTEAADNHALNAMVGILNDEGAKPQDKTKAAELVFKVSGKLVDRKLSEPPRLYRRLYFLREWSLWNIPSDTHRKSESERCGWFSTTRETATPGGRRSARSPRRSDARRSLFGSGFVRPSGTMEFAPARRQTSRSV